MPSQDILDKKIKNPDTGREIKVSSALNYDDNTAVKKKALQLIKKSEKENKIPLSIFSNNIYLFLQ